MKNQKCDYDLLKVKQKIVAQAVKDYREVMDLFMPDRTKYVIYNLLKFEKRNLERSIKRYENKDKRNKKEEN